MKNIIIVSLFAFVLLSILSCGEEGLIAPHGEVGFTPPFTSGLQAFEFPTNHGSAWTYLNVGFELYRPGQNEVILDILEETFTIRIEGTRDISGFTNRQATISEVSGTVRVERIHFNQQGEEERVIREEERLFRSAVDHLSANGLYFRADADFLDIDLPLSATYFSRVPQAYTESAFDAYAFWLGNPVLHQRHFPPRLVWDFPLQIGKEWTVFETRTPPAHRVVRRVIDANVSITVPAGSYDNAYLVEEEIVGQLRPPALKLSNDFQTLEPTDYEPAKYWVVPNIGVVKYQYPYILTEREFLDGTVANIIVLQDFELTDFELPDDNSR